MADPQNNTGEPVYFTAIDDASGTAPSAPEPTAPDLEHHYLPVNLTTPTEENPAPTIEHQYIQGNPAPPQVAYPPPAQGQAPNQQTPAPHQAPYPQPQAPYPPQQAPAQQQQAPPYPQQQTPSYPQQQAPYPQQQSPYPPQQPYPGPPPPYEYSKSPPITGQPQAVQYPVGGMVVIQQPQPQQTRTVYVQQTRAPVRDNGVQGLAITSLVCSIVATFCCLGILCTIPAIVLAAIALGSMRDRPDQAKTMAQSSCVLTVIAWGCYVGFVIYAVIAGGGTY